MKHFITSVLAASVMVAPASAAAMPVHQDLNKLLNISIVQPKVATISVQPPKPAKPAQQPKPQPIIYTVVDGDSLSKIGTAYQVEWQRIYAKNPQVQHPDRINIGDQLTIPAADEQLSREIPADTQQAPQQFSAGGKGSGPSEPAIAAVAAPAAPSAPASYDYSNTYYEGQCTWYAKWRRGNTLPNGLGNANQWYSRASAMGMAVGTTPRAGAIGVSERGDFGHVVYVESVNSDGSILISEMNYDYAGSVRTITTNAGQYRYIY